MCNGCVKFSDQTRLSSCHYSGLTMLHLIVVSLLNSKMLGFLAMSTLQQSQNSHGLAPFRLMLAFSVHNLYLSDQNSLGQRGKIHCVCACMHACSASTQSLSSWELSGIQRPVHSTVWTQPWEEEGGLQTTSGVTVQISRDSATEHSHTHTTSSASPQTSTLQCFSTVKFISKSH